MVPKLYGLNAATGAIVLTQRYQAQWGSGERPVVSNNRLIVEDGYYGGISSYQASSLTRQWFVGRGAAYDPPMPRLMIPTPMRSIMRSITSLPAQGLSFLIQPLAHHFIDHRSPRQVKSFLVLRWALAPLMETHISIFGLLAFLR